jgi:4-hydroxyproline epimerase
VISVSQKLRRIQFVDSHTAGEPTRVVISGAPNLGNGALRQRLDVFRDEFDWFRSAVVNEPRGSDAVVGALLCEPADPTCQAGVIFFNNVGYLGMCGHGTIGLVTTLAYLGRITPGRYKIETPAGNVSATLHGSGEVTVNNVPSYRFKENVKVKVPKFGTVIGDVAWGGNWFFLVKNNRLKLEFKNLEQLMEFTWAVRQALGSNGVTGRDGAEIDHIEVFERADRADADSKNFVLCPGRAYDRSPCGTGTSAKVACLYADGKLQAGQKWRQESIIGSLFEASITIENGQVLPSITGSAFVNGEGYLVLDERDPFCYGIPVPGSAQEMVTSH